MKSLTDKLALQTAPRLSKHQIWTEVKQLKAPYQNDKIPTISLDQTAVSNRVDKVRHDDSIGDKLVKKVEKDHCHPNDGGTGLLQSSVKFIDHAAGKMQQLLVFSLAPLLLLFSGQAVSKNCIKYVCDCYFYSHNL